MLWATTDQKITTGDLAGAEQSVVSHRNREWRLCNIMTLR